MIDFYASISTYADHLAPIWHALPPDERGTFWCEPRVAEELAHHGIQATIGRPKRPRRLVVVAGAHDVWIVRKSGNHPAVLVEHGAGQTYAGACPDDPGWSGGPKREGVVLFLCPNPQSADRNRAAYPDVPALVVGSPRVEVLRRIKRESSGSTVALAFHHMGTGHCPEAGWALPHYEDGLAGVVGELRAAGCEVIGHGHPRARRHFARLWKSLGVEYVPRFEDVVRRASVYVCDNSSTQVESAACGIPQVLLETPVYRRTVNLWWRFAEPGDDLGLHCAGPEDVAGAVALALHDPPAVVAGRIRAVGEVYPVSAEGAAQRSADAIVAQGANVAP